MPDTTYGPPDGYFAFSNFAFSTKEQLIKERREMQEALGYDLDDDLPHADLVALARDRDADGAVLENVHAALEPGATEPQPGTVEHQVWQLRRERDRYQAWTQRLRRERDGEVWLWMGDGTDDPASLACPVLMTADQVRALVADAEPDCDAVRP